MKLWVLLLVILTIGCTTSGSFIPEPCDEIDLGKFDVHENVKKLPIVNTSSMAFLHAGGYEIEYNVSDPLVATRQRGNCDTFFRTEVLTFPVHSNQIAPEIILIAQSLDSVRSQVILHIGTFSNPIVTGDSVTGNSSTIRDFHSSFDFHGTTFNNVYHIYMEEWPSWSDDRVKGLFYSNAEGILAFYIDEKDYWIKK